MLGKEIMASHLKEEMNAIVKFVVLSVLFKPQKVAVTGNLRISKSSNFVWGHSSCMLCNSQSCHRGHLLLDFLQLLKKTKQKKLTWRSRTMCFVVFPTVWDWYQQKWNLQRTTTWPGICHWLKVYVILNGLLQWQTLSISEPSQKKNQTF